MVDDRSYYQHRAEAETALALGATTPSAMQAHRALAAAYRDRLALADWPQAIVA